MLLDGLNEDAVDQQVRDTERGPTETGAEHELSRIAFGIRSKLHAIDREGDIPDSLVNRTRLRYDELGGLVDALVSVVVAMRSGREEPCEATSK